MIRTAITLALSFFALLVIETSVLWAFEGWISAIPLLTIVGLFVMQRVGIAEGVAWFGILALLRGDVIAATIACTGPILTMRVFSTRSLYALFGIGSVSHALGILVLAILHGMLSGVFRLAWDVSYSTVFIQQILLIPGLYVGMNTMQWFQHNISSRIAFKP